MNLSLLNTYLEKSGEANIALGISSLWLFLYFTAFSATVVCRDNTPRLGITHAYLALVSFWILCILFLMSSLWPDGYKEKVNDQEYLSTIKAFHIMDRFKLLLLVASQSMVRRCITDLSFGVYFAAGYGSCPLFEILLTTHGPLIIFRKGITSKSKFSFLGEGTNHCLKVCSFLRHQALLLLRKYYK